EIGMTDTIAWLVEREDPKNPGCGLPRSFLGYRGNYPAGPNPAGYFVWLEQVDYALRFSREEAAQKFIVAFENMNEQRVHALTLPGLRTGDPRAIAVEQRWSD